MKGHKHCGFCEKPTIPPDEEPRMKGKILICGPCSEEYNRCFPPTLTTINNLPNMQSSTTAPDGRRELVRA